MKKLVIMALLAAATIAGCKQRGSAPVTEADDFPDTLAAARAAKALPEEPVFDIVTNYGTIKVRLYKDTPRHKANFEKLALAGYYDSLLFHRVINGFMIQGGDPYTRDTAKVAMYGMGGPNYTIPAEMRDAAGSPLHRHKKGVFGETVAGFNVIDKIASVKADRYDRPLRDVRIIKIIPDEELNNIERKKELAGPEFAVEKTE